MGAKMQTSHRHFLLQRIIGTKITIVDCDVPPATRSVCRARSPSGPNRAGRRLPHGQRDVILRIIPAREKPDELVAAGSNFRMASGRL